MSTYIKYNQLNVLLSIIFAITLLLNFGCKAKVGEVVSDRIPEPIGDFQIILLNTDYTDGIGHRRLERKLYKVFEKETATNLSVSQIRVKSDSQDKLSLNDKNKDEVSYVAKEINELISSKSLEYIAIFEPIYYTITSGQGNSLRVRYDISIIDLDEDRRVWRSKTEIYLYGGIPKPKASCKALVKRWQEDGMIR